MSLRNESNLEKKSSFKTIESNDRSLKKSASQPEIMRKSSSASPSAKKTPSKKNLPVDEKFPSRSSSFISTTPTESPKKEPSPSKSESLSAEAKSHLNRKLLDLLKDKIYPDSVTSFIQFLRIYNEKNEQTRAAILTDKKILEKVKDIVVTFYTVSEKKAFKSDLAHQFIEGGISEKELNLFNTIFLHKKILKHLHKKLKIKSIENDLKDLLRELEGELEESRAIKQTAESEKNESSEKSEKKEKSRRSETPESKGKRASQTLSIKLTGETDTPLPSPSLKLPPAIPAPSLSASASDEAPKQGESDDDSASSSLFRSTNEPSTEESVGILSSSQDTFDDKTINGIRKQIVEHLNKLRRSSQSEDAKEKYLQTLSKDLWRHINFLYKECDAVIIKAQLFTKDKTHQSILKTNEYKILEELARVLTTVLDPINPELSQENKRRAVENKHRAVERFARKCNQTPLPKRLSQLAIAIAITLSVAVACTIIGTLIGIAAGAWTGPGAAFTAFTGAFIGGSLGLTEGIIAASAITGITVSALSSHFSLFKPSTMQVDINEVTKQFNTAITHAFGPSASAAA